jgi:filamentous hemagglutinin
VAYTMGFESARKLHRHFRKHCVERREFSYSTEAEYLTAADRFLGSVRKKHVKQDIRKSDAATIRYDPTTEEFGILSAKGVIETYFLPSPTIHGLASNLEYFEQECLK